MLIFSIVDIIFNILVIGVLIYMYSKVVKLENTYNDLNIVFRQIGEIILRLDKNDKILNGLVTNLGKITQVVDSLLPKETNKEPKPVKRSRKKKTAE
jgi:hypothetical protein